MKTAIIGTGISGLGAAYLLHPFHDITLYEKNDYIGGHTRTIDIPTGHKKTSVDTGFIVFNNRNYPNLMGLFNHLKVPYQKSDMSFGVSIDHGWLEYGSGGMFAQKKNWFRPAFYGMLADILRFNQKAEHCLASDADMTLSDFLDQLGMGNWFRRYYLLAMGAAIWSCPIATVMQFPARTFVQFFKNHGLLSIHHRPQWYTVTGGSRAYVVRLINSFQEKIRINCAVKKVMRHGAKVSVLDSEGQTEIFDQVVFACHADEALQMIDNPTEHERSVLGNYKYQNNQIIVHGDTSFMPRIKQCWSSWVYLSEEQEDSKNVVALSYWMNRLQNLDPEYPVIVTLNPGRRPREDLILDEHRFSHPVFDLQAVRAQDKMQDIQGKNKLWFCGAYQRYGFHEDGLLSAVNVAQAMGAEIPWQ